MPEKGDAHSRDPNTCASCSSLSDGMPESSMSSFAEIDDDLLVKAHFHKVMDVAA
jgi:hypothetical protein